MPATVDRIKNLGNHGYRRSAADKADDLQAGARLLPSLLPRQRPATDAGWQVWNIGPLDSHRWTGLDTPPSPTDQKVGGSSPSERAQVSGPLPSGEDQFANGRANTGLLRARNRPAEHGPAARRSSAYRVARPRSALVPLPCEQMPARSPPSRGPP